MAGTHIAFFLVTVTRFILLFVLFLGSLSFSQDPWEGSLFTDVYDAFLEGKLRAPTPERHQDEKVNYVFVTGFLGDYTPFYWGAQVEALSRILPRDSIHVLKPSSHAPIGTARPKFEKFFSRVPGKLVIIAHSKGAAEVLDYSLYNADFVKDRVERIYTVQGALGGTPLADAFTGDLDRESIGRQNVWERARMKATLFGAYLPMSIFRQAIRTMRTDLSHSRIEKGIRENPEARSILAPKLNYIVTSAPVRELPFAIRGAANYLQAISGDNDGVIPVDRQRIDAFGTQIGHLKGNHGDFTNFMVRRTAPSNRDALIHAVYLGQEKKEETASHCKGALVEIGR